MDKPKLYKSICPRCLGLIETVNNPDGHSVFHGQCFIDAGLNIGGKK